MLMASKRASKYRRTLDLQFSDAQQMYTVDANRTRCSRVNACLVQCVYRRLPFVGRQGTTAFNNFIGMELWNGGDLEILQNQRE